MNWSPKPVASVAVASCVLALIACGSSGGGEGGDDPNLTSATTSGGEGEGEGSSGGSFSSGGASGSSGTPKECAAQEAQASLAKRPVDIIFVIDNSGSMSGEIAEVENQINANFAAVIDAAKVDYRVVMVTRHGANASQRVCVKAPLSGAASCTPPAATPTETTKFFHHNITVASTDAWCRLLTSFGTVDLDGRHATGWGGLLRTEAYKVFVAISDDRISSTCNVGGVNKTFNDANTAASGATAATLFDETLLALSPAHFGTEAKRNYVFHTINGMNWVGTPSDFTKAWLPTDPVVTATCGSDSVNVGHGHQAIAIKTGGLRYPSCRKPGNLPPDYGPVFKEMAKSVIAGATLACEFDVPAAPAGETLDLSTVVPRYTPGGGGAPVDFGQVPNAAACAPDKFYIEGNKVKLCPQTCDRVRTDGTAQIKVLFGCAPKGAN
ncbi:MAG: hypothetical protein KF819_27670 [Labilithrix sp.]|nr:hypothetical protein [Labilithrix sp.]